MINMINIIFFILTHILLSTQIIIIPIFYTVILSYSLIFRLWSNIGPDIYDFMFTGGLWITWFLLLFIKIFFLIFLNKICKKDGVLGKFFEKLKSNLIFRIKILCLAVLLDLSTYLIWIVFLECDNFSSLKFLYLFCFTGVLLSYISLYIWFDIQKFINFIKKKICRQG